ncbi:MAG: hypothetical protein IKQ46_12040 [Bacteroidales bacterium]|nr:hypothetical protein [Bacteroidales bacterium]
MNKIQVVEKSKFEELSEEELNSLEGGCGCKNDGCTYSKTASGSGSGSCSTLTF